MNEEYMKIAISIAKKSKGEVPVGAVIMANGKVIAAAHNTNTKTKVSTNHAEILAINKACKKLKANKLVDCDIYVTKEPCLMCMGAIIGSRIRNLYFGCYDRRFSVVDKIDAFEVNHKVSISGGILEKECGELLSNFFETLR